MKVLVTGHKGFIGSRLFDDLRYEQGYGYGVEGLDSPDDIGDWVAPSGMFAEHYDCIIHLAAFAALRDSIDNPEKFWENNVRLLYASSAGAHGWWQNPYAITKKANELMAPPNSVGMRFFNVWAEENSRPDMLYRMLQENTAKYITRHKRDYIHVNDVVRAIAYLMSSEYIGPIDIGTGEAISVQKLAEAMGRPNLPVKENTPGEPDSLCADTTELRKLGWFPIINIMDTFKENA